MAAQKERLKHLEAQLEVMQQQHLAPGRTPPTPTSVISTADVQTLRTRAAQGDAKAQTALGVLHFVGGYNVSQDYSQARQWLEKAAVQGFALGQFWLGRMYKDGSGVPQDYAQARQWLEKAATQGNANAQFDLESLYAFGHGVPQDYAMARLWYEKAAAQGMRMGSSVGIAYTLGP